MSDRWTLAAEALDLVGAEHRGAAGPFPVGLRVRRWLLFEQAWLVLDGPADEVPAERAAELVGHVARLVSLSRWGEVDPGNHELSEALKDHDAVVSSLDALQPGKTALHARVARADPRLMRRMLIVMVWLATQLGWARCTPEERLANLATTDDDPEVRLRALMRLLGGWTPGTPSVVGVEAARRATADSDLWVRALGAVHTGHGDLLTEVVLDPATPHVLTLEMARRAGTTIPVDTLEALLDHVDGEVVKASALALARVGGPAQLPALRKRLGVWDRLRPGASAVAGAITAIEARVQPHLGQLSVADDQGGELSEARDAGGDLSV